MSDYPEHDKLHGIAHLSQAIGEFIDWCQQQHGIVLASRDDDDLVETSRRLTGLLAEHFGIDEDRLEAEKRAMLDAQRALNEITGARR